LLVRNINWRRCKILLHSIVAIHYKKWHIGF
jgi:hypothetical protein